MESPEAALNQATANLAASGVFIVVAAGNEHQDACNVSPASTPSAFTVAASDQTDTKASFSNYVGDQWSTDTVNLWIREDSVTNVIKSNPAPTPNRLLFTQGL